MTTTVWPGAWVAAALDAGVHTEAGRDGRTVPDLVGLAVRRNPRRAHLLVSTVLGKHIPTDPATVLSASAALGAAVAGTLGADAATAVVFGYAETATALGHGVADALGAWYVHSTRRAVPGVTATVGFEEAHSHASTHRVLPDRPANLLGRGPLVLVDDELSTGRTVAATVEALHRLAPRARYVVAALVDLRTAADRAALAALADRLGTRVDVVALVTGAVTLPADVLDRGAVLATRLVPAARAAGPPGALVRVPATWPPGVREGGRHGIGPAGTRALHAAADQVATALHAGLPADGDVVVLGTEELMYAPLHVAAALARRRPGRVLFSTTTRSPVLLLDDPGYAVRSGLAFTAHDLPAGVADGVGADSARRYVYNLGDRQDDIVVVVDDDTSALHAPGGLLDQLRRIAARVHLVVVPVDPPLPSPLHGPTFGSYAAADVSWLLTDLSGVALEAPTEVREQAIQSGGAHYAESLPVEYQPGPAYRALYEQALDRSAARLARAVGVVTELVLDARGPDVVLASLARAGTPVGVLMRRWAARFHGLDVAHYAISIVRGRGLDEVAARYLAAHHDPATVAFVDGWTGKGAITGELAAAVERVNDRYGTAFSAELAVLADPGSCVRIFGTREDFLVPSACLNSTVSGLVSRTVLNRDVLAPHQFHGAKFYAELAPDDVSGAFVDAVAARFGDVQPDVDATWRQLRDSDRTPSWAGRRAVQQIAARAGIADLNLVKPGVGETTRVLLRRVPWQVLVRPDAAADTEHVRLLARERGVPVVEVDDLGYSCVGLIHPHAARA